MARKKTANTGFDLAAAWGMTPVITPALAPPAPAAPVMPNTVESVPQNILPSPNTRADNCDAVFKTLTSLTATLNAVKGCSDCRHQSG